MNRILTLAGLLAGFSLVAQKPIHYVNRNGNVDVLYLTGRLEIQPGPTYHFDVRYPGAKVVVQIKDQGLTMAADRVVGDASNSGLKTATATGGVQVIQKTRGVSEIRGSSGKYLGPEKGNTISLAGPVVMIRTASANAERIEARGSAARVLLATSKERPFKSATLQGPVTIDATHRVAAGSTETLHATGGRLDLDDSGKQVKITLSGDVAIEGKQFGRLSGVREVTMLVNERGEVTTIRTVASP